MQPQFTNEPTPPVSANLKPKTKPMGRVQKIIWSLLMILIVFIRIGINIDYYGVYFRALDILIYLGSGIGLWLLLKYWRDFRIRGV